MKPALYTFALAALLAGCDQPTKPPAPQTELLAPQREALDKSKQVQQTVNEQAEQQKQAIDQEAQ